MQPYAHLMQAAVEYLNAGLPIIALDGKRPNFAFHQTWSSEAAIRGKVETTEDRQLLREVLAHPKTTGIGIPIPEYLVVVDIDGEEGAVQWLNLVGRADLVPDTPVASTGRGLHLWFHSPRPRHSTKLGQKLDLKGAGGYVVAPPSLHPEGRTYQWLQPLVVDGMLRGVEYLPDAVEQLLDDADSVERDNDVVRPVYTLYQLSLQDGTWRMHTEPTAPPIDGLLRAIETAEEGNRNNMLHWAASTAAEEGLKLEEALQTLGATAIAAGLTNTETRQTIRSAYRSIRG